MEIINVVPRGFCKGVVRAIELAKQTALKYPDRQITVLGELVHNKYVVEALRNNRILTVEDKSKSRLQLLDEINEGVVIFSAHGVSDEVIQRAEAKGLILVNATCDDVIHTQNLIREHLQEGFDILYIGQRSHPEAQAIAAMDINRIHLITAIQDLNELTLGDSKVFVTNQTTMSQYDTHDLMSAIARKFPQADISNEICSATRLRQDAVKKLENVDCLIVVGDINSNNTTMLAKIGQEKGIRHVFRIESAEDLPIEIVKSCQRVAITAGASTPYFLIKQVNDFCSALAEDRLPDRQRIDSSLIL